MPRSLAVGFLLVFLTTLLAGCGDEIGRTVPVTGKVSLDGKTLTKGSVTYWPDEGKSNSSKFEAVGQIDESGSYTLSTRGKPGAAPGWYKVVVSAAEPSNPKDPYSTPKSLIDKKYSDLKLTTLSIEVKDNPSEGAYDLKVTK